MAAPEESTTEQQMIQAGHAHFTLSLPGQVLTERETALVNNAVVAGVLGALGWLREHGIDLP